MVENTMQEIIKNRGDVRGVDIFDIITSSLASKYGAITTLGVETINATTDINAGGVQSVFFIG